MAELEVAKHTKKVFTILGSKHKWWHKLKDIAFEIAIIIFAVSVSIWLHNRSEKNHDREEASLFLEGLKTDLQSDILQMKDDRKSFEAVKSAAGYFKQVSYGDSLSMDSLGKYVRFLYNSTQMNPNGSRFEGMKASGKLAIIEDKDLLNEILYFYQHDMPLLNLLNSGFNKFKFEQFGPLLDRHLVIDRTGNGNWEKVFRIPEFQNMLIRYGNVSENIEQYNASIHTAEKIIGMIKKDERK